jgi:hypothetical protein
MQTTRGEVAIAANHASACPPSVMEIGIQPRPPSIRVHLRTVASMTDDQCLVIERRGHHA